MKLDPEDMKAFQGSFERTRRFWKRLGGEPDVQGKAVLDVGCGHGGLAISLAKKGAARVVGLDVDPRRTDFSRAILKERYPEVAGAVSFYCQDLCEKPLQEKFDVVISMDAFEHMVDPEGMLRAMIAALKKSGRLYAGFGPLYRSPYGDHGWTFALFPWGHLIFPERFLLWRHKRKHGWTPNSLEEMGLNKWSLKDFRKLFSESGLKVLSLESNRGDNAVYKTARILAALPFFKEYFTFNFYVVLEKTE